MRRKLLGLTFLMTVLALSPLNIGFAQFSKESKWIPGGANCVVLVNGERIFNSQLAQKENWQEVGQGAFERGTSVVPPQVDQMMIASQFDLAFMQPVWTVSVLTPSNPDIDVAKLAAAKNRATDTLGDQPAMLLPNDVYLVELDDKTYGAMAPADRQSTLRWIEAGKRAGQPAPAPYIAEALAFADKNSDVIIAFDLNGAIDVDSVRTRLKNSESIAAANAETAAKAIARLRGFMLGITVKDKIYAALKVDFAPGTTGLETLGKNTIIEALENNGVMIDDVRDWTFSSQGGTLMLNGTLSDVGMRQINLLVAQPVQAIFRGIGSTGTAGAKALSDDPAVATRRYLDRIELCFKDFEEYVHQETSRSAKPYQRWFSAGADQIDMLPAANVAQAALDFGGRVSEGFRDISQLLIAADAGNSAQNSVLDAQKTEATYGYYAYGYGYGYGYRRPSLSKQKAAIRAQSYAAAKTQASEIMNQLKNDLGDVRRNLPVNK